MTFHSHYRKRLFITASQRALGPAHTRTKWDNGRSFPSDSCKKLTCHFHSLPKVKKKKSYTTTSPYICIAWYFIKHRNNLTPTFCHVYQNTQLCLSKCTCSVYPQYFIYKNLIHMSIRQRRCRMKYKLHRTSELFNK